MDTGIAKPSKQSEGDSNDVGVKTRTINTIYEDENGAMCIGADCAVIRIPKSGHIEVDTTKCPDNVGERINKLLEEGSGAKITTGRSRKGMK